MQDFHSVRAECKARYGGPCIKIYASDMQTVVRTADCVVWCPLLNRRFEEVPDANMGVVPASVDGGDSNRSADFRARG